MSLVGRGLGIGEPGTLVAYGLGISTAIEVVAYNFDCAIQTVQIFTIEQSIDVCAGMTVGVS